MVVELPPTVAEPVLAPTPSTIHRASPRAVLRVALGDGTPLYLDALGRTLRDDRAVHVVAEASDAGRLVAAVREHGPDVIVVDRGLLAGLRRRIALRSVPTLVLVAAAGDAYLLLELGARGIISKDADGAAIRRAVAAVGAGATVLDGEAQTATAAEIRLRARDERPQLTRRERQILVLVAAGRTAPDIARRLQLSTATVKTHLIHLYEKLGVSERAAAVAVGMRAGLLE